MIRLVGNWFAFGAPRSPLPCATYGVEAQPTMRMRAPKVTARKLSSEISPPDRVVDNLGAAAVGQCFDFVAKFPDPAVLVANIQHVIGALLFHQS